MSLLHPPPGFPPHLAVVWPLIWVQVLLLRAGVRAAYGKGVQYRWSVTPNGRVFLASIDWLPSQKKAREWLTPPSHPCERLASVCGRAYMPAYAALGVQTEGTGAGPASARQDNGRAQRIMATLPLPEI
ncbi:MULTISPECIES: hypothetical protein [Hyphomonas]|uniref:Uncharacterized protein n=1 Tax=Hyphomonas adhaerens TaxID=81029 RepID=A0A3B9GU15_9PROT|nr:MULTISPECIES: hypothetical protein [Hyphomonas]MBB38696.1 hypothetical protein [Hyphomonas sp.]HAE25903.1 hypothetical protein [Hyphomonas adhaerens]|tara:strand:- start:802 stop:1188 length:387 start_codon:yes stop_codon:yes gene_type:complete